MLGEEPSASEPPVTNVIDQIEAAFTSAHMPAERELVRFDGVDDPGKAYLREHLAGKTQDDVLRLLREGRLGNGSMCTEELELAEPAAISYYLEPFLLHFAERMLSDPSALDDEVPFFLFAHIDNILRHRGASTFSDAQLRALSAVVGEAQRLVSTLPQGLWVEDVSRQLRAVGNTLDQLTSAR